MSYSILGKIKIKVSNVSYAILGKIKKVAM